MADSTPGGPHQRLDAFTDAAFAFALTILVVGAGGGGDYPALVAAMAAIPSFAIGFSIIAMFWWAHVRWRMVRGPSGGRSILLTIALIFLVLVYVVPLRAMAISFAGYLTGTPTGFDRHIAVLFAIYGAGFAAMALVVALLFHEALPHVPEARHNAVKGEGIIWAMLVVTGVISLVCALVPGLRVVAPWVYATLPLTIGVFAARWKW
jgi:uncharacterized membrane protein